MIISWLVFSDLHFQFSNAESQNARERLVSYVAEESMKNGPIDFILTTGDCFHQYKQNTDIKKTIDYIHSLVSAAGCGKSNVYITPGNHDLERTELRLSTLRHYTGIDYESGKKTKPVRELENDAYPILVNTQYFRGFFELYNNIVGKKYDFIHKTFEMDNYRIVNINTCTLSGGYYNGKKEEKKELHLDEGNLSVYNKKLIEDIKEIPDDDKLNIAFMHHGVEYFRESEQAKFQQFVEDRHIDLIFTGHSHKIGIYTYDNANRNIQELTCGAPIVNSYSEPSFFWCYFDTETKNIVCKLCSYIANSGEWQIANTSNVRKFKNGVYEFVPERFNKKENTSKPVVEPKENLYENAISEHFNKFGIVDALPMREFIALRNKLIQQAEGNLILAGQSLENAFDIRKDSESIVDSIKKNKKIKNIDIFLTDPVMYDSSTETYDGDTPISRIDSTMHTILYDIAFSLTETQSINIYFIPLVQLDHMVFVNDILLLRHTLLWTNNNHYKATPLVCKKMDDLLLNESIVKSSMYNVYKEYINKLKEESMVIDIQENGYDRQKETVAKIKHSQWRQRLYRLRASNRLKGQIVLHKLYRTQLISDLHSSWDSRFRTFSSEISWADELETTSFIQGRKTKICSHDDLYKPENLLNDDTQKIILPYVRNTEILLNKLVKKYDKEAFAKIYPSLDIGIPNNILRFAGGFATGMLVVWKCGTPIVPVDTTVNVCSSSYYQFDASALNGKSIKEFFNEDKINKIINEGSKNEGLAFSFNTGNHFLLLCRGKRNNMYYLVLHSSAKQFKDSYLGLYPKPQNWYSGFIKTYKQEDSERYIRYLKDDEAKQFIAIAKMLNRENEDIHNWFAKKFCKGIHFTQKRTYHHYGMPTDYSIAIGTYVIDKDDVVPIFSREDYPIWLFKPDENMWSIELEGKRKYIVPHGWGQSIKDNYIKGLKSGMELSSCGFEIKNNDLLLKTREGEIIDKFSPDYENRFPEKMVEVRQLWDIGSENENILKYNKYISGTIEEVLEPIALFSKNNDKVKYYDNKDKCSFFP